MTHVALNNDCLLELAQVLRSFTKGTDDDDEIASIQRKLATACNHTPLLVFNETGAILSHFGEDIVRGDIAYFSSDVFINRCRKLAETENGDDSYGELIVKLFQLVDDEMKQSIFETIQHMYETYLTHA